MIQEVIIRPPALEDIMEAVGWYEERQAGLGRELLGEVTKAIQRAQKNPDLFQVIRSVGQIRRVITARFPYRIFFSVVGEILYVHAVFHGARQDGRWHRRL